MIASFVDRSVNYRLVNERQGSAAIHSQIVDRARRGPVEQGEQDPGSGRIGHRPAEPVHDVETGGNGQHTLTIQ